MANYLELQVFVPPKNNEGRWFGSEARALIAFLADQEEKQSGQAILPSAFFHYVDRSRGHTMSGPALIRFSTSRNAIRIIGIGDTGVELLEANATSVSRLLARHFRRPFRVELLQGAMDIEETPVRHRYISKSMALTMHPHQYKRFMRAEENGKKNIVANLIRTDINRLCDILLIPVPGNLEIVITDLGRTKPVIIKETASGPKYALCSSAIHFLLNAKLTGPWAVGHLQSRAYGAIYRDRSVAVEKIDPRVIAYVA